MNLRNYLTLDEDPDTVLVQFDNHSETKREITDPVTRLGKTLHALEFHVIAVNGQAVQTRYSVVSDKEFALWSPYLADRSYKGRVFRITKTGRGFRRETTLELIPGA